MILYVDETENDDYFIVAGLLANSETDVELAYKRFKNNIKGARLTNKAKEKIYTEFKSTLIDKNYFAIKKKLLEEISLLDSSVLFSAYKKKSPRLNQIQKQSIYITLISNVLSAINEPADVVFDGFNNAAFENDIIQSVRFYENISSITPGDAQAVHGLQFADNICSTIRLHLSDSDEHNYYSFIKHLTSEI